MASSSRLARALSQENDRPHSKSNEHQADGPVAHPLLRLQRQIGNAQVSRLIAQRQGEEDELAMKRDPAMAQRQEEEELEGEAMAKHDPAMAQRQEEEEMLQGKHDVAAPSIGLDGGPVGPDMESTINSKRGGGSPLDAGLQQKMETSLNTSLGDVRVHSDAQSDALNRSMTAKAFTTGSDIFLRQDVNQADHSTMAHEVAHVVQQRDMSGSGGGMTVGAADSGYEKEADEVAHAVNSGSGSTQREIELR